MLRVNGGPAGSGTRVIKKPVPKNGWTHTCYGKPFVGLESCYTRCPDCGAKRP